MRFQGDRFRRAARLIVGSIEGVPRDYTKGSLPNAVIALSIPMVLEMVLESVFALVDVFWVARLGSGAVATVGITEPVMSVVLSTAMGIGVATTAIVARRIGENDQRGAASAAFQSVLLTVAIAPVLVVLGPLLGPRLMTIAHLTGPAVRENHRYVSLMLAGSPSLLILSINNAILRGAGAPSVAMRVLWLANLFNLILDPLLIFGFGPLHGYGIVGAALATTIGRSLGVIYQYWILFRGTGRLRLAFTSMRFDPNVMGSLARTSSTGILQFYISDASWLCLVWIIGCFGDVAVAAYTIAMRIVTFAILPSWGLGNATATLVGQSLGSKNAVRAERAVWIVGGYNVALLGAISIVLVLLSHQICSLYSKDTQVAGLAASYLQIIGGSAVCYGFSILMAETFDGAGDTLTPTIVSVVAYWLIQVPFAFVLSFPLHLRAKGAVIMVPVGESIYALICLLIFSKGKWKEGRV